MNKGKGVLMARKRDDDFDFDFDDDDFDDDDFSDDDFDALDDSDDDFDDDLTDLDDDFDDDDFDELDDDLVLDEDVNVDDDDDFDLLDDDYDDDEPAHKNKIIPVIAGLGVLFAVGIGAWFMIPTGEKSDDSVTASEVVSSTQQSTESESESTSETSTSETPTTSEEPEPVTGGKSAEEAAKGFITAFYVNGDAADAVSFFDPEGGATVFGTQEEIDSFAGTSATFTVEQIDAATFNATVKAKDKEGADMEIPMSLNMVERENRWYVESIGSQVESNSNA